MRGKWHQSRCPADKKLLNKLSKEISSDIIMYNSEKLSMYLESLSKDHTTKYSLWKCTKKFKQPALASIPVKIVTDQ